MVAFGMGGNQGRQALGQRFVGVVVRLEVQQGVHQRAPFALGDADREEEQDGEVGGLFHLDPNLVEVGCDQGGRDAAFLERAIGLHAGGDHRDFDRVEHAIAIFQVLEAMPGLARVQHPAVGVGDQQRLEGHLQRRSSFRWQGLSLHRRSRC